MRVGHKTAGVHKAQLKSLTLNLLEQVLPERRAFAIRLWDGTTLPATVNPPRATLVLTQGDTLSQVLEPPLDLSLVEAYIRGELNIEGDLESVFKAAETVGPKLSPLEWVQLARQASVLRKHAGVHGSSLFAQLRGRQHSRERDRQAVQFHYDLSNRFYKLWLDKRLVYSCAYFPKGNETLDKAQEAKTES